MHVHSIGRVRIDVYNLNASPRTHIEYQIASEAGEVFYASMQQLYIWKEHVFEAQHVVIYHKHHALCMTEAHAVHGLNVNSADFEISPFFHSKRTNQSLSNEISPDTSIFCT